MTFTELFNANESTKSPSVEYFYMGDNHGYYCIKSDFGVSRFAETEAALLCARLLALLPARTASMAIELAEIVRREREEGTAE